MLFSKKKDPQQLREEAFLDELKLPMEKQDLPKMLGLIADGINVNIKDKEGYTPLMLAVIRGQPRLVEALIEAGAALDVRGGSNLNTPLILAVKYNNLEALNALIEAGAALDVQNKKGNTALMVAAVDERDDLAIMECLIKADAALNVQNKQGYTALTLALEAWEGIRAQKLVEAGADVYIKTKAGETAMSIARTKLEAWRKQYDNASYRSTRERAARGMGRWQETLEKLKSAANNAVPSVNKRLTKAPPAPADRGENKVEELEWSLSEDGEKLIHVENHGPQASITEIFNFASRERLTITQDAQAPAIKDFRDLPEPYLKQIFEKFKDMGGTADEDFALRGSFQLGKPRL